jgi:hypothetical protein
VSKVTDFRPHDTLGVVMRATLDRLNAIYGLALALVLLLAGIGMLWGSSYIKGEVDQQMSSRNIVMPTEEAIDADEGLTDEDKDAMRQFAGSQLDTAAEAKAYADHFIAAHASHVADGETYATLGPKVTEACGANRENADTPECMQLSGQRDTLFKADTLQGLLQFAWMGGTIGTAFSIAGWIALLLAAVMALLAGLGFRHANKVDTRRRA